MEYLVESQRDLVNSSVCCQCIINQGGNHKDICSCKQGHTTSPCTNNCPSNCLVNLDLLLHGMILRIFRISFKVLLCLMLLFLINAFLPFGRVSLSSFGIATSFKKLTDINRTNRYKFIILIIF